jgi:glycosyltransferase involved in cell wall biosynthesis
VFTFHTKYWEYTHYVPFSQDVIQEFLKNAVHNWLRGYLAKCQHIVIPSESIKEFLVNEYGLQDGYTVIPTGTELEPSLYAGGSALRKRMGWEKDRIIVSIGRLASEKNWETLLRALAQIQPQHPDVRLVLIGDGPDRPSLEQLAAELGVAERITFTGALPFSDVPAYMRTADLFSFASVTETQGLVTIEAMAAGLPVVAVDGTGTRDIVENGVQGYLAANDPAALAAEIDRVLSDPKQLKRFAANALKRSRQFDINQLTRQLVQVYEQAIQDKKEGRSVTLGEKAKDISSAYQPGTA